MLISQLLTKVNVDRLRQPDVSSDRIHLDVTTWSREVYQSLPRYASIVMDTMMLACGPTPWEEEQLVAELRHQAQLAGSEVRTALAHLGEAGLVYVMRRAWGEQWWVIPSDLYIALWPSIYPCEELHSGYWQSSEVLPLMDVQGQFRASVIPFERTFMYGLSLLASNDASFTSKGLLVKKTTDRLASLFQSIELSLAPFNLQRSQTSRYPLGVAIFLEAAHALGLVKERDGQFILCQEPLSNWLRDSNRDHVLQDWLISRLSEAAGAYSSSCGDLCSLRIGEGRETWRAESALVLVEERRRRNRTERRKLAGTQENIRWSSVWLEVFSAFGWLEFGQPAAHSTNNERLYRWKSRVMERVSELLIQPSGELIAGPGFSYVGRWELELIAERRQDGELTHYMLSARTIAAAIELGRTKSSITDFLLQASGSKQLPSQLAAMIEQWASSASQFEFVQATLLHCGSSERADWLASHPEVQAFEIQRIGLSDFVVQTDQITMLRKLLQQSGFPPRKGVASSLLGEKSSNIKQVYPKFPLHEQPTQIVDDQVREGEGADETELGVTLSTTHRPEYGYQVRLIGMEGLYVSDPGMLRQCALADVPVPDRLVHAEWQSLPQMWSTQLRAYHLSTRKELLQKAIALELSVRLKTEGELRSFVPERLEQRGADWSVVGVWRDPELREEVRLSPEMWDEMGISLPEGLRV
ncbi:helicase-associated domain-containing protein [Paenibacillus sp. strain BS8-2]